MARIIILMSFVFLIGCAGQGKKSLLNVNSQNGLFKNQDRYEDLKSLNDKFLNANLKNSCIGNWEKRVSSLKALLLKKKNIKTKAPIWHSLGGCYSLTGDYRKSVFYYDLYLSSGFQTSKKAAALYSNMGLMHLELGLEELSKSYFKSALNKNQRSISALLNLAIFAIKNGESRLADQYLNKLLKYGPSSKVVWFLKGVNYFHSGDYSSLKNKVFRRFNEKADERVLFSMALDLANKRGKDVLSELKDFEVKNDFHNEFKVSVLSYYGKD